MTDTEFETLVDQLFEKHALKLGGDHWAKGDLGLDEHTVHDFVREFKEILEKRDK
jgi:hypothetical protein